jgi:type II secretory pathway pseudopilin PulG
MRKGFTLVETIVALLLVQFGLLAVAATSAITIRDMAIASRAARARDLGRERLELLRSSACAAGVAGSRVSTGLTEHWRITGDGPVRTIEDSVEYALPRGRRGHFVIQEKVLC